MILWMKCFAEVTIRNGIFHRHSRCNLKGPKMDPCGHPALPLDLGLSRLRSATFEHFLEFGATFYGSSNVEQISTFLGNFCAKYRFRAKSSSKKSTIS